MLEEDVRTITIHMDSLNEHPYCSHGPTLLFSRGIDNKKFYACSAHRERKKCSFFVWENQLESIGQKYLDQYERNPIVTKMTRFKLESRFNELKKLNPEERCYCQNCGKLFSKTQKDLHIDHSEMLIENIDDFKLSHPSQLFRPLQESKSESQYFFTENTIEMLTKMFHCVGTTNVICIGAPTIHERILHSIPSISSILLDIDHRYLQFYECDHFRWFNMYNCHVLEECDSDLVLENILTQTDSTAVFIDPPFGGRLEPLAYTLNKFDQIRKKHNKSLLSKFLVLPYFMERFVIKCIPGMSMLDYKIDYINHKKFNSTGRNKGSPIRIFTNVDQCKISLPVEENYKYCDECNRWVCSDNEHCYKCNSCTSKNGRKYIHCNLCKRCVKRTWKHCKKCNKCCLLDHRCNRSLNRVSTV
uniref:Zinc finger CCHC domain-containing protein 4 n=1 Tax=Sipha flava TaxID=143950 RepID=A0A2S2QQ38_9HEMI